MSAGACGFFPPRGVLRTMSRPVLLPFDGSAGAELASEHAFEYARRHGATLHALYVVDSTVARSSVVRDTFDRRGETLLAALQRRAAREGLDIETERRAGVPHEEILEYAAERDVRAIVMGVHGRSDLERLVLGSVTQRVVRSSPVPVLTVGGPDDATPSADYDSILVPTDGSDASASALDAAIGLAAVYDAGVHVVHVVETDQYGPAVRSAQRDALRERGADYVAGFETRLRDAGIERVTTAVREGRPAETILAYSDERAVDCIVMSTHGRTGVARRLLGSTTERVLRATVRPVLCVPSAGRTGTADG